MATCVVSGTFKNPQGTAISGATVRFNLQHPYLDSSNSLLLPKEISTTTAVDGTWSLTITQGMTGNIYLDLAPTSTSPVVKYTFPVVIPASSTAAFASVWVESDTYSGNGQTNGVLPENEIWVGNSSNLASAVAMSGDATIVSSGAVTVASVGGSSAANVHAAELLANAATSSNTVSTIVKRDSSGNFSAGTITGTLSGSATSFSGSLVGDVTGTQSATVVSSVGGSSAANVHSAELLANAATDANTASAIVKRDSSGNISIGALTAAGTLTLSGATDSTTTGANARIPVHTAANITFTNASLTSIASANITGISGGHTLCLTNYTGSSITLVNNYASAAAGEAIFTGSGSDVTIQNKASFWLQYNSNSSAWISVGAGGGGGSVSVGTIDAQSKSADGLVYTAGALYAQTADATYPGMLSTGTQTIAGAKTFTGAISASNLSGTNTGDVAQGNLTEATSAVLTITGGTNAVNGSGTTIQVAQSSGSTSGYLSSTDWTTFNNKQSALTTGNLTEATSSVLTITGGTGAVIGSGLTIQVAQSSGSTSGYLSSTDWTTFNNKQATISLAAIGASPNANGATLSGAAINLEPASASFGGVVTTGTQTLAGAKTFNTSAYFSANGAASTPPLTLSGAIFTGGSGTTTFPMLFISDSAATASTSWSTSGTYIGVLAKPSYGGNLMDLRLSGDNAGTARFVVDSTGTLTMAAGAALALKSGNLQTTTNTTLTLAQGTGFNSAGTTAVAVTPNSFTQTSGTNTVFKVNPTYNQASGTASNTDFLVNRTTTAVGSGTQLLMDLQAATVSKFSVNTVGTVTATGSFAPWTTGLAYVAGAFVQYGKNAYQCVTAHTAAATFAADVSSGNWILLNQSQITPNLLQVGSTFEANAVDGWVGTGCATVTNGLPVSVGSGGAVFSTSNGGRALGANTTAAAVTSSSPINNTYSLNLATSGAGTIGDGYISASIPISSAYQAKVLQVRFRYKVASGTPVMAGTSSNTYAVAVYDVTNNAWLPIVGPFNLIQSSGVGNYSGTVQTASSTAAIQIFVYSPVAPTGSSSLLLDDFYVGPQIIVAGPAVSDSKDDSANITPNSGGFGTVTNKSLWTRRVGDRLVCQGSFTAGTTTATTANLTLTGYTIDTAKFPSTTSYTKVGMWKRVTSGGTPTNIYTASVAGALYVQVANPTILYFADTSVSGAYVNTATNSMINTGDGVNIEFDIPIAGWSSNMVMSSDTDTRVVAAIISGDPASASSGNPIIVPTVGYDSHAAYNASTGRYTVPVTGIYRMYGALQSASSATTLNIYKNAVSGALAGNLDSNGEATYCAAVNCVAGDIIDIRPGGTVDATSMTLHIERLSGPATVAANETVSARYYASSTSVSGTPAAIVWTTKDFDTHNAFSSSTFTCPVSGKYQINAGLIMTGTFSGAQPVIVYIYKNGSEVSQGRDVPSATATSGWTGLSDIISCNAGDTIQIYGASTATSPAISASNTLNHFSIVRVGN